MIFLIDNYDSFTYNLYQQLLTAGEEVTVRRNDDFTLEFIEETDPSSIIISPGPGEPSGAGLTCEVIREFSGTIPIFGVCLGHQAIAKVFGGRIVRAKTIMHGKCDSVFHENDAIFRRIESPFTATRYHSLIVSRSGFPECLKVTAWTEKGEIMGLRHRRLPVFGVQFHPESFLTPRGKTVLRNFLRASKDFKKQGNSNE